MTQTIYITETNEGLLHIKIFKDYELIRELLTAKRSEEALSVGSLIEEYMKKGDNHYKLDVSNDYKTFIHILEG